MKKPFTILQLRLPFLILIYFLFFINAAKAQPDLDFNPIIQNLSKPVKITNAGDGSGRLFIAEQTGKIKIYKNGNLLKKPFLDISGLISNGYLKGLLSITFSPDYPISGVFFVLYTDKNNSTIIARYKVSKTDPDSASSNSSKTLLSLNGVHPGDLNFGKDGYLYITLTDGSYNNKITQFAQDLHSLYGKMLRLDTKVSTAPYYSIPHDNPFVNNPDARPEIWAVGLRNAWRWSFDRSNGDLWLADVGGGLREELNLKKPAQPSGINFGWPCYEGNLKFKANGCLSKGNYTFPIFDYSHNSGTSAEVIIGGYVYNGRTYPSLRGYYLCVDFTKGYAWKIKPRKSGGWDTYLQKGIPTNIESFGEDEDGELYATSQAGIVYKIQANTSIASFNSSIVNVMDISNLKSQIYPTIINNNRVMLDLKETYDYVRMTDISGREIIYKSLSGKIGKVILNLPHLNAGTYMIQLLGSHTFYQKVFVPK